jgi:uncharacterized membrane protein
MVQSPQDLLAIDVFLTALIAFLVAGTSRYLRVPRSIQGCYPVLVFWAAYILTYNKIPSIPPVGAVNKVFYISVLGAIFGVLADQLKKPRLTWALICLQPVLAAAYIGKPLLADHFVNVLIAALAGLAVMLVSARGENVSHGEAGLKRAIVLVVAAAGFAPIALLGASSSSFQLSLIFAFALASLLIWYISDEGFELGGPYYLGAVGGMLSVAYTVTLITAKTDLVALAILGLVFLMPHAARFVPAINGFRNRLARLIAFAVLCLFPAALAVAVAIASYGSVFQV